MPLAVDFDPYAFPCDGPVLGIPHGFNVLTNLAFLVVGVWGLAYLWRRGLLRDPRFGNWVGLWASVALLCFGSGAYHYWLTPFTLAFDRACIAGIMAFLGAHALTVTVGWGPDRRISLLFFLGAQASVAFWALGGTSLVYGALQALGGIAVLVLFVRAWRRGRIPGNRLSPLVAFLGAYALAKIAELFDAQICEWTAVVGGHPLKHVLAAVGLAWLGRMMVREAAPVGRGSV